jgi:hypothetical protein
MEEKINIEELEKQCIEAEKNFKTLQDQLTKAKEEEQKNKLARLAAEKDVRYKEVINSYENFEELRSKYVDDYGSFTFTTTSGNNSDTHSWFWNSIGLF